MRKISAMLAQMDVPETAKTTKTIQTKMLTAKLHLPNLVGITFALFHQTYELQEACVTAPLLLWGMDTNPLRARSSSAIL
jgi:hypothetical protein